MTRPTPIHVDGVLYTVAGNRRGLVGPLRLGAGRQDGPPPRERGRPVAIEGFPQTGVVDALEDQARGFCTPRTPSWL